MCPIHRCGWLRVMVCVNLEMSVCAVETRAKGCRSITSRFQDACTNRGGKDGCGWWILGHPLGVASDLTSSVEGGCLGWGGLAYGDGESGFLFLIGCDTP